MLFKIAGKLFKVAFLVANPLNYCNGRKESTFASAKEELRKVKELTRRHRRFLRRFRPRRYRNSRRRSSSSSGSSNSSNSSRNLRQRSRTNSPSCPNNELPSVSTNLSDNTSTESSKKDVDTSSTAGRAPLSAEAQARRTAYNKKKALIILKNAAAKVQEKKTTAELSHLAVVPNIKKGAIPLEFAVKVSSAAPNVDYTSSTAPSSLITASSIAENTTEASSLTSSVGKNAKVTCKSLADTDPEKEINDDELMRTSNKVWEDLVADVLNDEAVKKLKEEAERRLQEEANTAVPKTKQQIPTAIPQKKQNNKEILQTKSGVLNHQKECVINTASDMDDDAEFQKMFLVLTQKEDVCSICKEKYDDSSSCSDQASNSSPLEETATEESQKKFEQEKEFLQKQEDFLMLQQNALEAQNEQNQMFNQLFLEEAKETANFRGVVIRISNDKQRYEEETNRIYIICGSMACFAALIATHTIIKL
ncbi:hypothetical protein INT47_003665 [Mucor saturninus]|uniref:Uncharacterized protein n=1 Tax=Mucor saturninus TaxID=64648 RepID=A0A8H7V7Y8_9FUNG|nr:hypothetical protein INT47_003665 [Mucor saturninus]